MASEPETDEADPMHALADEVAEQLLSGAHPLAITNALVQRGVPLQTAKELIEGVNERLRPLRASKYVKVMATGALGLLIGTVVGIFVGPMTPPAGIRPPIHFVYAWCGAAGVTVLIGLVGWWRNR